jgi:PAS domain S-box-containing protein
MESLTHILHLEDDTADSELVQAFLEEAGLSCRITRVQTGGEFAAALSQGGYDLILADFRLPGYDGMSALRLVQEMGIEVPFIFISGTMGEDSAIEGLREGATDYVLKQKLSRLVPAVKRALGEAENRRERQRAERSLAAQFQFLQLLIDTIPSPIFYKDINGVYLECNQSLAEFLGRPKEDIIGKNVFDIYPREQAEKYYQMDQELFQNPGTQIYDFLMERADGAIRNFIFSKATFVDVSGKVAGIIGVMTDITERKLAEEELIRAKNDWEQLSRQMELILNSAGEGIFGTDVEGKVTFVNPALAQMLGWETKELLGRPIHDLCHHTQPDGTPLPSSECQIYRAFKEGRAYHADDEWYWRQDGTSFPVEYTSTPIREGDEMVGTVVVIKDITERKQAEEAKLKFEAQLRQAQKLEAIGTLAGGIAHDFNNILGAIIGYGEMIQMFHPSLDPQVSRNVGQILKGAHRAKDLVRQILAFSRKAEQDRKAVKLQMIIKESLKFLRASLPSTIEIRSSLDPEVGPVLADPTQMQQVVMNLCTNAAHAMREKGGVLEVRLTAMVVGEESVKETLKLAPGLFARLTVQDNGHGIPPDILERIFDPYFTTKEMGEGTGLGLAVAEGIIQSHGGAITVESGPGVGTVFQVFIPMVEKSEITQPAETPPPILTGQGRVLFVDDEPALTDLGQAILKKLGFEVEALTSSAAALEKFLQNPRKYDLAIVDLTMPQMTGIEMARKLLEIRPDLPIILSSGFAERISTDAAKEMGIRELIIKPWSVRALMETIKKVLG